MPGNDVRIRASMDDKVSGPLSQIQRKFEGLGKSLGGSSAFGKGLGLAAGVTAFNALGQAASSATDFIKGSIAQASDLNESLTKSQVVFGDSAKEIEDWAETASDAFGQSKQQALEAAGTYGNLFQAFGVGREEATKMSKSLVELAADLASFNNTSVDDALLALRSGLSGETEPLKRFGVALSDSRMRTELMAQGVKNLGTTLTPLQKSTAAYAIIMHDSALAQGDFARTSDGLANKQRILDAKMEDLSAELGERLIPFMQGGADTAIAFADAMDYLAGKMPAADKASEDLLHTLLNLNVALPEAGARFFAAEWQKQMIAAAQSGAEFSGSAHAQMAAAAAAVRKVGETSEDTADRVGVSLDDMIQHFKDAKADLESAASEAADAIFDPIEARAELNQLRLEQGTKELTREQLAALATLAAHGEASQTELNDAIVQLTAKLKGATAGEAAAINDLIKKFNWAITKANLLAAKVQTVNDLQGFGIGFGGGGRAHGGPVEKGVAYTVGEAGPETFVAPADGRIIPAGGLPGMGGASRGGITHVHIYVDGDERGQVVIDTEGQPSFLPA